MKSSYFTSRALGTALVALCLALAFVGGVNADEKEYTGDHPIRVLPARYQNDNVRGGAAVSARGNLTIWLQNPTSVIVDGIEIEVELYNRSKRKVETLKRSLEKLDPGEKKVLTFRWDVMAEDEVTPRFFIAYNSRGTQKTRFEGDTPTWN